MWIHLVSSCFCGNRCALGGYVGGSTHRMHGLTVIGATLTPCSDADGFSEKKERIRVAINRWYQTAGVVDGVIDFDKAVRDPTKPSALNPAYDSGDHLHPNDEGYAAMAKSINLSLFRARE